MITLKVTKREESRKQLGKIRAEGFMPGVIYGASIKESIKIKVLEKEFAKVFNETGESSIFNIEVDGKKYEVLTHQVEKDALSHRFSHADFYHPSAKKQIEVDVPLVFKGSSLAVKELGGVLIKDIQELKVKGLPQDLPKEIVVDISSLKTFEDRILIKDLKIPKGIEAVKHHLEDIVATVGEVKKYEEPAEEKSEVIGEGVSEKEVGVENEEKNKPEEE